MFHRFYSVTEDSISPAPEPWHHLAASLPTSGLLRNALLVGQPAYFDTQWNG